MRSVLNELTDLIFSFIQKYVEVAKRYLIDGLGRLKILGFVPMVLRESG